MKIDPVVAMWIKIVIAIATAISSGTLKFTGIVSTEVAVQIVAYSSFLTVILGIVMSAYSSSQPGPAAPQDPPLVKAAEKLGAATSTAEVAQAKTEINREVAKT